jgi:hypothetical protein
VTGTVEWRQVRSTVINALQVAGNAGETRSAWVPASGLAHGRRYESRARSANADAFADRLAARFALGAPYPRPYPIVPIGPQ